MSRPKKFLYGILFATAVLAMIELVAALTAPLPHAGVVVSSDRCYFGWGAGQREHLQQGSLEFDLRTDDDGFRVGERPHDARCDILALGDSFTEGLFVRGREAWPAVLERELRSRGYSVRVHNGGMRGHTIVHERIAALDRWPDLRPAIVIVEHTSNDLADLSVANCALPGAALEIGPDVPPFLLRTHIGRVFQDVGVRAARQHAEPPPVLDRTTCDAMQDRYAIELRALALGVRENGGRTIFVEASPFFCRPEGVDFEPLRDHLRRSLSDGDYLDARQALQEPGSSLAPLDGHPSPLGHQRMAERIAALLGSGDRLARCRAE